MKAWTCSFYIFKRLFLLVILSLPHRSVCVAKTLDLLFPRWWKVTQRKHPLTIKPDQDHLSACLLCTHDEAVCTQRGGSARTGDDMLLRYRSSYCWGWFCRSEKVTQGERSICASGRIWIESAKTINHNKTRITTLWLCDSTNQSCCSLHACLSRVIV